MLSIFFYCYCYFVVTFLDDNIPTFLNSSYSEAYELFIFKV